jgi:hypothetical protein
VNIKPLHIYDELFRNNYYISYGVSVANVQKAIKKYIGKEWEVDITDIQQGKCMYFDLKKKGASVIWIWTLKRCPWVLAHECLHACYYAFGMDRVGFDNNSQELYAYSIEMLMRKTLGKGVKNP